MWPSNLKPFNLRLPLQLLKMPRRKVDLSPAINEDDTNFKLQIKPSKIHRWGIYAAENIPARRKVIEYTGERISRKETKRRSEQERPCCLDKYWTSATRSAQRHLLAENAHYCWTGSLSAWQHRSATCPAQGWPRLIRGEVSLFLPLRVLGWIFTRAGAPGAPDELKNGQWPGSSIRQDEQAATRK